MFKPLIRTIPTLSGNFTLACHLRDMKRDDTNQDAFNVIVRNASFIPLQNKLYDKIINANLNSGKYEYEITKYYKHYSNYFYNTNFSFNEDDYQILNRYSSNPIEQRNRDYEFGCKRVQKTENDFQFMFYAPMYIDSMTDAPDEFRIDIRLNETITKTINVSLKRENKNQNLLYNYIRRYVEKIDDNVVYCMHDTCQAMYDGIDVKLGGLVRLKDDNIGSIYVLQQTMNNFDYTICDGFARNNIVMKQIIPLSFTFNIDDVLTQRERKYFTNHPVKITGAYYRENTQVKFYDFSVDYVDYHMYLKEYDVDNHYTVRRTTNIMDCDYPALHDGFYYKYKYTNKFTPQYCRWKLKYTDDDEPYVTNMNYAFSYVYADKNNQYGDFPNIYVKKPTMNVVNLDVKRPTGDERQYYVNSLKNNTCGWYTTVNSVADILDTQNVWRTVNDDKVYYKGILYDLNNYLSSKRSSRIHSTTQITDVSYSDNILYDIDEFGVFVEPRAVNVTDEDADDYKLVENVVTLKTTYSTVNCRIYDDFERRGQLFASTTYMSQPALYENDVLLKKTSYGDYEIVDDYFSYDTWYDYDEISSIDGLHVDYSYVMNTFELLPFDSSNCLFVYDDVNDKNVSVLKDSDAVSNILRDMYVSDKRVTQKTLIQKDKIYENVDENNYFIRRDFVNLNDISEDRRQYLTSYTKYNYTPTYKNDDVVNENYMRFSKENTIYMNDGYHADNIDQLFVDEYDMAYFVNHVDVELPETYVVAYGEPVSSRHIEDYVIELSKNDEYVNQTSATSLLDDIYVRDSYMYKNDETKTLKVLYDYHPISSVYTFRDVDEFMDDLSYDGHTRTFTLMNDTGIKLFFKRKYYALTRELYEASVRYDEPLMLYRVNDEHEDTVMDHQTYDVMNLKHTFRSCMKPLIHGVKKIDVRDEYRALVNSNKIREYSPGCMVYTDIEANGAVSLILPGGRNESDAVDKYEIVNKIDIKYSSLCDFRNRELEKHNIRVVDDIDTVVRGGDANLLYHDKTNSLYVMRYDGKNYMFYYMNIDYLCTNYSFNMNESKFSSVYGREIKGNDTELFDIIAPYFKESIFNKFTQNVTTMLLPSEFKIPIHYIASLHDDGNTTESYKYEYLHDCSTNVYDIKYIEKINKKMSFRRYFDSITPLICECRRLNCYHLYHKNIDTYISENNLYRRRVNMYEYAPIKCVMRYDENGEPQYADVYEYEYKHFNDNLMWNLTESFTVTHENTALTYEQLLEAENEKTTFYHFKKYMLNNSYFEFDDETVNDTMLFLFNKYKVTYISEPLKLNVFMNKRQYKLIYKFILM